MSNETTPKCITNAILNLCHTLRPSEDPILVPAYPFDNMRINQCFHNVSSVVDIIGGRLITGWVIWQWDNILVEAEAHAIWESPDNQLIDVTPHISAEKQILFLPDDTVVYTGTPIPSHRQALTNSPLVAELITLYNKKDEIAASCTGATYEIPIEMYKRIIELQERFHRKSNRNDTCPCGSGLKYKKCCGRYHY